MEQKPNSRTRYLYGPVPSRRLGLSLGVDVVPAKLCTLDCVYCQLGKTTEKTVERRDFVPTERIVAELKKRLAVPRVNDPTTAATGIHPGGTTVKGHIADFVTIGGSGEPTLNCRLGELIDAIRAITDIPTAILTNGTLLDRPDVRAECAKADVVLPSLDAGDEQTFQKVNRPHRLISIGKLISGLCAFRREFSGQMWLEVFLVDGLNTGPEQLAKIRGAISQIRPDKVQVNTAIRPARDAGLRPIETEKLKALAAELGPSCEVIADFSPTCHAMQLASGADDVLSMLKRRPCSLHDISAGLGIHRNQAIKHVSQLLQQGLIGREQKGDAVFFKALP